MQLEGRKRVVLQAVIEEHVRSAEPVGSEHAALLERLRVSPATIRGVMAALEDEGLLMHPHTSAGRVPTDQGYRAYVDMLPGAGTLLPGDRQVIRKRLAGLGDDAAGLIDGAAGLLASLTQYASVVASPGLPTQTFHSLHLLPAGGGRALAVIATSSGSIQGRVIDLPSGIDSEDLEHLSRMITQQLHGCRVAELTHERLEQVVGEASRFHLLLEAVRAWLRSDLATGGRRRYRVEGTRHLVLEPEFRRPEMASRVLTALEEETILTQALAGTPVEGVYVSIGAENRMIELRACSVVAATYTGGESAEGTVAIVGPTRMRYRRAVATVRYVANSLSEALRRSA